MMQKENNDSVNYKKLYYKKLIRWGKSPCKYFYCYDADGNQISESKREFSNR
jgi:hypothetical protein